MPAVVILVILAAAGLPHLLPALRGKDGRDAPARIVAIAAAQLPAHRRDWGQAMAAELAQVRGRVSRWQFAVGVLRVVALPPARHPRRAAAVAVTGLAVTAAATAAAVSEVPAVSVFVAVLALLLCGCATAVTSRSLPSRLTAPYAAIAAAALAAAAASVAGLAWIAAVHPAAASDPRHMFSVLLALILGAYLAVALIPPRGGGSAIMLRWALAGTLACGTIGTAAALADGPAPMLAGCAVVTAAVAYGASAATGSRQAGARAGLLTVILGTLTHFAAVTVVLAATHRYTLTSPYDVARYHHSGAPDVASYVIGDGLAGAILSGLLIYPAILAAIVLASSAAGARRAALEPVTGRRAV
jgi:hypothetical protein